MKQLIMGVLASIMLVSNIAVAQAASGLKDAFPPTPVTPALPGLTVEPELFVINVKAVCGSLKQIEDILRSADEFVFAKQVAFRAAGPIEMPGNPAPAVMTVNPRTTSWTIIENLAPNVYCITSHGPAMAPGGSGVGQRIFFKE
jgi:hypothetical protein